MSNDQSAGARYRVVDSWFDEDDEVVKYVAENDDGEKITGVITRNVAPHTVLSKKAARSMARDLYGTEVKDER